MCGSGPPIQAEPPCNKLTRASFSRAFPWEGGLADPKAKVVILGAGHAGGSAAAFLRQYGHEGPIVLIGDEPIAPYQRPPLSKAWLKGEADASSLALKDDDWYAENDCDLRLGVTAVSINRGFEHIQIYVQRIALTDP